MKLVGQPELKKLLNSRELRQLNQRITARYHLRPLSLDETRAYIRHRLLVGGGNSNIFKAGAVRRIHRSLTAMESEAKAVSPR